MTKAIIQLPPRNDTETEVCEEYRFNPCEFVSGGQKFIFPEGYGVNVRASWLDDDLLGVNIGIDAVADTECARCLKAVSLEISGELMYLYYSQNAGDFDDGGYMPVEVEYFGRVLDVMPQIEESIYTLLPVKVLCSEDCRGLCPFCGQDLNEGTCSCREEITDPRLSALRNYVVEGE